MNTIEKDLISSAFIHASKIRFEKRKDYGGLDGYFPFGAKSYIHELNKKVLRLKNLVENNLTPFHESIKDNLLDLINYSSYYYEYLIEGELKIPKTLHSQIIEEKSND